MKGHINHEEAVTIMSVAAEYDYEHSLTMLGAVGRRGEGP
jgi:hypothetical protein